MDTESLIEQVASAHRERSVDGDVKYARGWHDLNEADRVKAFDVAAQNRELEAALDAEGLSSTARAVLARLGR